MFSLYFLIPQIHFVLAELNEIGRFTNQEPDLESAMFHLEHAASCFFPKAVKTQAQICLQLPHEVLSSLSVEVSCDKWRQRLTFHHPTCIYKLEAGASHWRLVVLHRMTRKTENAEFNVWRRPVIMATGKPCYIWHVLLTLVAVWPMTGEIVNHCDGFIWASTINYHSSTLINFHQPL